MILIPYCVEGTEILSKPATMMKMIPSQAVDTMETFTKDWGNERTDWLLGVFLLLFVSFLKLRR